MGKLKLSKVPEKPWTHLTVDFITKLLLVAGKYTILVAYNRLCYDLSLCIKQKIHSCIE